MVFMTNGYNMYDKIDVMFNSIISDAMFNSVIWDVMFNSII